jgi:hypothetical protein
MNLDKVISQLDAQSRAIALLISGLSDEEIHRKPDSEHWSILEVIRHLVFEEIFDFRTHIMALINSPLSSCVEKDPDQWKTENLECDYKSLLTQFQAERKFSMGWLSSLADPDWDETVTFSWGSLRAGELLASWLAHDLLHLRQIIELRYALTIKNSHPYLVEYAGEW